MSLRPWLVRLHRWCGLLIALFLLVSGLTGALISWDHELDAWLNPRLFVAQSGPQQQVLSGLEIASRIEQTDPRLKVNYVTFAEEPGHTLLVYVEGRTDPATGQPYVLPFNQLAVDPATAQVQGQRMWGQVSFSRENLLPFLYKLHYSMHLPLAGGYDTGMLLMGGMAIVWFFDCFIALWLSFPNLRSWRKSLQFRWRDGGYKLHFDLHRSGGVWLWLLLAVLALTSISMNLETQLMRPLVARFATLSPNAFDTRTAGSAQDATLSREQIVARAQQDGRQRGFAYPAAGLFYASAYGLYGVGFFAPGNDHGDGGLGNAWLYYDSTTGAAAGGVITGQGSWGDIFLQAQFPLHSGRIIGTPGRVLMSLLGLAVATLSLTGLIIWAKKRRARRQQDCKRQRAAETTAMRSLSPSGK